jgi:hypothetical protein
VHGQVINSKAGHRGCGLEPAKLKQDRLRYDFLVRENSLQIGRPLELAVLIDDLFLRSRLIEFIILKIQDVLYEIFASLETK